MWFWVAVHIILYHYLAYLLIAITVSVSYIVHLNNGPYLNRSCLPIKTEGKMHFIAERSS